MNNPQIIFEDHFKLYVSLKDIVLFQNELEKQSIEYYCDLECQPDFEGGIRYFIRNKDRENLDEMIKKHQIIAGTETIPVSDYREDRKIYVVYLKIVLGIVLILLILMLIKYLFDIL